MMGFGGEIVSVTWLIGIIFKSTLLLLILLGLSFALSGAPTFRHRFLLLGLLGVSTLPLLNLLLPPLSLNLPTNLLNVNELISVLGSETSPSPYSLWLLIISCWFLGALFLLGRLILGVYRVKHISQKSLLIDDPKLELLLAELKKNLKFSHPISLLISQDISTPMTWGFWKPKIILPECALSWSKDQCHMILLHELAHIKRVDWLTQVFTSLVCSLYWFNPLVWILAWQLRLEREKACDIKVLASGIKPSEYARMLLGMAKFRLRGMPTLMTRTPPLEKRLKEILAFKGISAPKRWHALSMVTICGLVVALASLNPSFPETLLAENSLPDEDREVAALMWQLMSAQEPELKLASDYEDSNWEITVSKDDGNTKVAIALPNIFNLKTWSDLISSPSMSVSVDSEGSTNKVKLNAIEINTKEKEQSEAEKADGYWL